MRDPTSEEFEEIKKKTDTYIRDMKAFLGNIDIQIFVVLDAPEHFHITGFGCKACFRDLLPEVIEKYGDEIHNREKH